jgi:hypothetical protein
MLGFVAALALAGAFVPAFASAQTAPYYGNCNTSYSTYPYNYNQYPYNNYPYGNCPQQGMLFVYLQVSTPANSYYGRPASDFSISVSGGNAYPTTFPGSLNGQIVSVLGSYSVTAASFQGFTPSYSSGCTGTVSQGQQASCVITETPIYPYNYQYPQQYPYTQPYVTPYVAPTPTVYIAPVYSPKLPNTGFEPLSSTQGGAAIAFAVVAFIAIAFLSLPYVRKAFAATLG